MPSERPVTLVVAEHTTAQRSALCRTLEGAGFRVLQAKSARETLSLVRRSLPDLVLLNLQLPDIGGVEVCGRLKSHPDTNHIPVIQISSGPIDSAGIIRCFENGADDCIAYPLPDDELLARVRAHIHLHNAKLSETDHLLWQQVEVHRMNAFIRATLARLKAALEIAQLGVCEFSAQQGVWQHDPVSGITQLDKRCRELFGISQEGPLATEEVLALIHPEDRVKVEEEMRVAFGIHGNGILETECRIVRPDGTERWVAMRVHEIGSEIPVPNLYQFVGTMMDITERKNTQELLIRSEKVAALGRMAATLAHEINNPLAAVVNALFIARSSPGCPETLRQYLDIADEQVKRVCHITRQALGFYREPSTPSFVAIGAILQETVTLFKGKLDAKRVKVEGMYDGEARVVGISGELRQVFSNLVSNSLDAIPDRGTIKLRVSSFTGVNNDTRYVRITVADNGEGIEASARQHLFEPLFTTKGMGGTGLGLWVSKQIIDKHGGSIRVRSSKSEPHKGTVFSIVLPAAPAGAAATPEANALHGRSRERSEADTRGR